MTTTRVCKVCKVEKPFDSFPRHSSTNNKYRRHECVPCYSEVKALEKAKKREWLLEFKKTLTCASCGTKDIRVLDFHHDDANTKEINISQAASWSIERLQTEIAKCSVLCVNCHMKHHAQERKNLNASIATPLDKAIEFIEDANESRKCRTCMKTKSIHEFQSAGIVKGVHYRRHVCSFCKQKSQLVRKLDIKAWLKKYKAAHHCVLCNETNSDTLEFHHRDGTTKDMEVSDAVCRGWSIQKIKSEIQKCMLLCGNCHRILHYEERKMAKTTQKTLKKTLVR